MKRIIKGLHAIKDCSIPQGSTINFLRNRLNMIDKHAAEGCFNGHNNESKQDLYDARDKTQNLRKQDSETIP